jgi:prepilin peptidase CpaA
MVSPVTPVVVVGLAIAAAACDLRTRRVPNALTFGAAAAGLAFALVKAGVWGLLTSSMACLIGLGLFLPLFALGGMGAGDVKLLAAFGAWLGPIDTLWAALWAALAGGVLAVAVSVSRGYLPEAVRNLRAMATIWRTVGPSPIPEFTLRESRGPRLAYALPIGIGAILALWRSS